MTDINNINTMLLGHFTSGSGAAAYLRGKIPGLSIDLNDFFCTRSDIERIQKAEYLSERILSLTDFSDMIPLRSQVATLEIKRLIAYKNQTDHTAHTVYLYLLGVWVYDNIAGLREKVDKSINSSKPVKMFLFQWTFASLLHDVGYLFYDFEQGANSSAFSFYDAMISHKFMKQYAGNLSAAGSDEFDRLFDCFTNRFGVPKHSYQGTSLELITELNHMPWLCDLGFETGTGLTILNSPLQSNLTDFAVKMATEGYIGTPVVDHGVASALMLLKYTSFWYWLSNEAHMQNLQLDHELNSAYKYYPHVLRKHVIPACRAVAYHNIPNFKFSVEQEPLTFLAVLCDELQVWDRFLSGYSHIENWRTIDHCMAEKIQTELITSDLGESMLHVTTSEPHFTKILSSLEKRVDNWSQFVQISVL